MKKFKFERFEKMNDKYYLFSADIVGYTTLSSTISAATLKRLINRLYTRMDFLVLENGGIKVNMLGDCYQFAIQDDSKNTSDSKIIASRMLSIANSLIQYLATEQQYLDEKLQMRIGITRGNLFGGENKSTFRIGGEAVDVDSESLSEVEFLEQSCPIGMIHISSKVECLIRDDDKWKNKKESDDTLKSITGMSSFFLLPYLT
ncbi:MAG: Adenylate cyclase type 3 [Marteilia pararefringens]